MIKGGGLGVGYIVTGSGPMVFLTSLSWFGSQKFPVLGESFRSISSLMHLRCIVLTLWDSDTLRTLSLQKSQLFLLKNNTIIIYIF